MTKSIRTLFMFVKSAVLLTFLTTANSALAKETSQTENPWRVRLGVGVLSLPVYSGSDSEETRVLPLISVRYKRFFLGGVPGSPAPAGLGFYLFEDNTVSLAGLVSRDVDNPREELDDTNLNGLGDIEATTHAGLFMTYRIDWLSINASVLSDVGGNEKGTIARLGIKATHRATRRLMLSAGPGLSWGNDDYMFTSFGIDQEQAISADHDHYQIGSGIATLQFFLSAHYQMNPNWSLGASLTAARLQGDAADSPVVQKKNQNRYALLFMYIF